MCGRTACTLSKAQLQQGCTYQPCGSAQKLQPKWRQVDGSADYQPGYNMPPGSFLPVLYCDPDDASRRVRVISTMKWGLVPSWVAEDPSSFSLNMSNARRETLMEKPSFRNLVTKGHRCALLCEGFYEWARPKVGGKQPYFFHLPGWAAGAAESQPPRVMFIAGLYDLHRRRGHPDLHSFTVVTVASGGKVADIHHRMPAILQSEEQLWQWLHSTKPQEAVSALQPLAELEFYPVSSLVNSTQHNSAVCLRPVQPSSGTMQTLDKWIAAQSPENKRQQPKQEKQQTGISRWVSFKQKRRSVEPPETEAPAKCRRSSS